MLVGDLIRWCYQCDLVPHRPKKKNIRWLHLKDDVFFLVLSAVLLLLFGHMCFSCMCMGACPSPLSYACAQLYSLEIPCWCNTWGMIHTCPWAGSWEWCVSGCVEGADWKAAYVHVSDIVSGLICTRGRKTPWRNTLLNEFVHQRLTII